MGSSTFSRLADSMVEYVETKSGISIGMIHRPPPISLKQIFSLVLIVVIAALFAIQKILEGETMLHDWRVWMAGLVFIYFFNVARTMHNIIRNMPMFMEDKNDPNKLVFFYQGSGMQMGAEGFAVEFLYTIVGLGIVVFTHSLLYARSVEVQRTLMFVAMVVSAWVVRKVIYLDNWKTGYGIHAY